MQVTVQQIEAALAQDSKIKAVLLTSPNYYGVAADVRAIADCCHAHNAVLLVDEAHGPHLASVNCCRHPLCSAVLMPVLRVRIKFWAR